MRSFGASVAVSSGLHGRAPAVTRARQVGSCAQVTTLQGETDIAPMFEALTSGDPGPVAAAFLAQDGPRTSILRRLLDMPGDAPVAAAFTLIWQDTASVMSEERMSLLKWYLAVETPTRLPARRAPAQRGRPRSRPRGRRT